MNARDALLQLCDQSNWDDQMKGEFFKGYEEAMSMVHELVMEFWPELSEKQLPHG